MPEEEERTIARYAELVGREEAKVAVPFPATVGDVIRRVRAELPGATAMPERPLAAVNLRHVPFSGSSEALTNLLGGHDFTNPADRAKVAGILGIDLNLMTREAGHS